MLFISSKWGNDSIQSTSASKKFVHRRSVQIYSQQNKRLFFLFKNIKLTTYVCCLIMHSYISVLAEVRSALCCIYLDKSW